jgi:hypothetical protein
MEGYLLCVFGKNEKYYELSIRTIENIRKWDNHRPICILTDNIEKYIDIDIKDKNIHLETFFLEKHLHKNINIDNEWNAFGFYPKVFQSVYTPFEHTMYIDVDMIFHQDFTFIWNEYRDSHQNILIPGKSNLDNRSPSDWHWGKIDDVISEIGIPLPQVFSTLLVYKKEFSNIVEKNVEYIFDHLHPWKVQFQFRGGVPDEIIYSILAGINNIKINRMVHDWILDTENCEAFSK